MNFDFTESIGALSPRQKTYFYQLFAHFLTVSMRGVLFYEGIPDDERVERAKWLNEIAHRITYKVFLQENAPQKKWTDAEVWETIKINVAKHPKTEEDVNLAVEIAYKYVIENESEETEDY